MANEIGSDARKESSTTSIVQFWAFFAFLGGVLVGGFGFLLALCLHGLIDFFRWQTLIVGVLGTIAALGTVAAIYFQIRQVAELDENRRRRENLSGRAHLTKTLSNICAYQKQCVESLRSLTRPSGPVGTLAVQTYQAPPFPESDLPILVRSIETAEIAESNLISSVVALLQVQHARLSGLTVELSNESRHVVMSANIDDYLLNAVEIYARVSQLMSYARREHEVDRSKPDMSDISNALFLLDLDDSSFPDLWKYAANRYKSENAKADNVSADDKQMVAAS